MNEVYIARSMQIASRMLDGEMIIMSAVDSTLFNLNAVGTIIWQAADGITPLSEIVARRICIKFDVSQEVAYRDALEFVKDLESHGILSVFERPFVCDPPEAVES